MVDLVDDLPFGLDIGMTFCCFGVFKNGGVEIIPNKEGELTTPSIITILDENTILRGEETMEYLVNNCDSTIYNIKRFIGKDLNNEKIKKELEKENFPFKTISNKENNSSLIEVKKNDKIIQFTFEEISSFIIGKMIESAENHLHKKVKKLVITVPANFNDAQRNCTKQAALLAGVEVIRIINEPTAAAIAYGLHENSEEINNKIILVFDLGGGTFDVTILKIYINKDQKNLDKNYEILSTSGDKFLGGVDFDNVLVNYFLEEFCQKNDLKIEDVRKDKKAMRKLKISCEKIKRNLSFSVEETLNLPNFYNNLDIIQEICFKQFFSLSEGLIERLQGTLKTALNDAKITEDKISEVILVGGSTKLPMVKKMLRKKFRNSKINDSINPDETVAVGATLMAAKILNKSDNLISSFNLMDITPLSLGVEIINEKKDDKNRKEGRIMNVIIKRGSKIPYVDTKEYYTTEDNQTNVSIVIYEGESQFVKDNNILGRVELKGLPKRPKGKVKIKIKFFIDVNGILTVTSSGEDENGNTIISIETRIKNDMVNLTEEQIETLRKKNEKYKTDKVVCKNIRAILKDYLNGFEESNEDDKFQILMNYNHTLENFIDSFNKNFDNETMIEKYFLYVKDLFLSYTKVYNMENIIEIEKLKLIIDKIIIYINEFITKSFGYLENLIKVLEKIPNDIFYKIVSHIIVKLYENGKKCIKNYIKNCSYYALKYFKKANFFFENYIKIFQNLKICLNEEELKIFKCQIKYCKKYISELKGDKIIFIKESVKQKKLIPSPEKDNNNFGLFDNSKERNDKWEIILANYEKNKSELNGKMNLEEAICLANIIKIKYELLKNNDFSDFTALAEKCKSISEKLEIDPKDCWYIEFKEISNKIIDNMLKIKQKEILEKYQSQFDELHEQFHKKKNFLEFINYFLEKFPYKEYWEDKVNNAIDFAHYSKELIKFLCEKYNPEKYKFKLDNELAQLNYFLFEEIHIKLNNDLNEFN